MPKQTPMIHVGLADWVRKSQQLPTTDGSELTAERALYERGMADGIKYIITFIELEERRQERSQHG